MDAVALRIMHRGLIEDAGVIRQAADLARQRITEMRPEAMEACSYQLQRLYNVIERALERVCTAFENHFEKRGDYHEKLLERMALDLPEIRPAFLPPASRNPLRKLKSFRHLIRHAYDLEFEPDRLRELVELGAAMATEFPLWVETFVRSVERELGQE